MKFTNKYILTLDWSLHIHNKTLISPLPPLCLAVSLRLVIEICLGNVVSIAWEALDYGENGYDGPENLAARLISTTS